MMRDGRIDLYALDYPALEALLVEWEASRDVAREVWRWLYQSASVGRSSANVGGMFERMTTVPQEVRERLAAEAYLCVPKVLAWQEASGGATWKHLLALADGEQVEIVVLRYGGRDNARYSACISTQVGCACGCRFCATGQMGFVRQLSVGEIIGQVMHVQRALMAREAQLSNFVLMGMGEPLLNYDNVMAAIRRLSDPRGMALPQRRITLSTVGIVPGILRLAEEDLYIKLAVSLHAATDEVRDALMPINQRYPLDALFDALRVYTTQTRRRVMLEWVMIAGVNDSLVQAEALVARLEDIPAHVNLIHLNPTAVYEGQPASPEAVEAFVAVLDRVGIPHTMRQHRGASIQAGCGQLRARHTHPCEGCE
jgi:23S rRNA (adenine2503-C2)-methyltransferase